MQYIFSSCTSFTYSYWYLLTLGFNVLGSALDCWWSPRKPLVSFFFFFPQLFPCFILIVTLGYLQQIDDDKNGGAYVVGDNSSEDVRVTDVCPDVQREKQGVDPFRSDETDPSKSNAMGKFLDPLTMTAHIVGHVTLLFFF